MLSSSLARRSRKIQFRLRQASLAAGIFGLFLLPALSPPAHAQTVGGSGGAGSAGNGGAAGSGGSADGQNGGHGGNGDASGSLNPGGGGGGGGGPGGVGGGGGNGAFGAAGGTPGAGASANGGNGADTTTANDGGGGGAGGNGGANGDSIGPPIATFLNFAPISGGAGGAGGAGGSASGNLGAIDGGGGGGGGAGGHGVVITGAIVVKNNGTLTGGDGGTGGHGGNGNTVSLQAVGSQDYTLGGGGGAGGAGGAGLEFIGSGATLINTGWIVGGNGGAGGTGGTGKRSTDNTNGGSGADGAAGAGGVGVIGANLTITNSGTIAGGFAGDGTRQANAITFTGGVNAITFNVNNGTSGLLGNVDVTGSLTFNQPTDAMMTNVITGTGSIAKTGAGTLSLFGTNLYSGGTTISGGTLAIVDDSNLGNASGGLTFNGGTLQTSSPFPAIGINRTITLLAGGGTIDTLRDTILGGNISGGGGLTKTGAFGLALQGNNAYSGATNLNAGFIEALSVGGFSASSAFTVASGATLDLNSFNESIGSLAGAGSVTNGSGIATVMLTTGADNTSTTFSGTISDGGLPLSLTKVGSGTQILSGNNSYTGTTFVNGGTLEVDGSIASSILTVVNANATLAGTGTVGATQVNAGGIFAPGNGTPGTSMTVASLALASGAQYMVQINPTNSSFAIVTGAATLGGATVNATFASGTYVDKQYTILSAGSISGTFNATTANTNLPSGFKTALSYDATHTHAFLDLSLTFVPPPGGLNVNQQNVGNAIINFFNSTGSIPLVFGALTPAGLTQISGETATGSQQTTFDAMNQFLGVMTDPFIAGRGDPVSAGGNPNAYADEESLAYAAGGTAHSKSERDAYAAVYRKGPPMAPNFEQRWSVWAAGFGGSQTTGGNAALGSNDTKSSIYGSAVGADYRFSPNTLAGFALAGGRTNFSVTNGGTGRSDLFQAGAFIRHTMGAAYLIGALAYGWQDITTDRTVTVAGVDRLRAEFNANAWSGRVEGGYRFVSPWMGGVGITPYAAGQFTTFELPNYAESVVSGAGMFALSYAANSVTDTRSELGLRTDKSFAMQNAILTLRGRAAWAYDFNLDRSIGATFQSLPGASFVVNGAARASNSALTTASAELKWINGWSAAATFEGEFSEVTRSYAGKGVVRYAW